MQLTNIFYLSDHFIWLYGIPAMAVKEWKNSNHGCLIYRYNTKVAKLGARGAAVLMIRIENWSDIFLIYHWLPYDNIELKFI